MDTKIISKNNDLSVLKIILWKVFVFSIYSIIQFPILLMLCKTDFPLKHLSIHEIHTKYYYLSGKLIVCFFKIVNYRHSPYRNNKISYCTIVTYCLSDNLTIIYIHYNFQIKPILFCVNIDDVKYPSLLKVLSFKISIKIIQWYLISLFSILNSVYIYIYI